MSRQFGHQRVDLLQTLAMLKDGPLPASDYSSRIRGAFDCSARVTADAIAILRNAVYIEQRPGPDDRRRKSYQITRHGQQLLDHPEAGRLLRHARKLFTTCPSPRSRRKQQQGVRIASPLQELRRRERLVLRIDADSNPVPKDG